MALSISIKPTQKVVRLLKADPSGETTVTVRQATTGDMQQLANLYADTTVEVLPNGTRAQKTRWNGWEVIEERVFRTLIACNIAIQSEKQSEDDAAETPWFKFPLKRNDFARQWQALPQEIADEIYEAVTEVNKQWAFSADTTSGE